MLCHITKTLGRKYIRSFSKTVHKQKLNFKSLEERQVIASERQVIASEKIASSIFTIELCGCFFTTYLFTVSLVCAKGIII